MSNSILSVRPLGAPPWATVDPFLFCVHHDDAYPRGNDKLGPNASLSGRNMGMDFEGKDGWRMYHGSEVPGFPQHPHRGFETITIVRRGLIDHSDSLGAAARFGAGDVQWMTAGSGIVHSEMFPLVHEGEPNPLELFQIWLNLPKQNKLVPPHFSMMWNENIPRHSVGATGQPSAEVTVIAGEFMGKPAPPPPPSSWASQPEAEVAIWTIKMQEGSSLEMPPARLSETVRTLYFFQGDRLSVDGKVVDASKAIVLRGDQTVKLHNEGGAADCLMLQGLPIAQPVAHYGPFVMNTQAEIAEAISDYQRTRFGGWPWPSDAPVHPRAEGRFARHADGRVERA